MKYRNIRRRVAIRYLAREYGSGRWWHFRHSTGAECRAQGHARAWHRRNPFRIYGEDD